MMFDHDIVVAGGGLVGLIFALAAARENLSVAVCDDAAPNTAERPFDGRAYALSQSSCRLLAALGMTDLLNSRSQEIRAIRVADRKTAMGTEPVTLGFDSAEIETGPMGRMVEDRHLRRAVMEAVKGFPDLIQMIGSRIAHLDPGEFAAVAKAGDQVTASRLIAGCDGRGSAVAAAAGIRHSRKDYRQSSIVCAVEHELPHGGAASQFFMPSGPLAILPLQGNRSSLVWTVDRVSGKRLSELDDSAFLRELRIPFGGFLGEIALIGRRAAFPLALSMAERLAARRVALLGEAAHMLHPLAGQGLNLGFRDAASLAEILGEAARRGEDIGSAAVLERYQSWRRFDAAVFAAATDGCNWLFSNADPVRRAVRGGGMTVISRLPALRRGLIREAAGLHGHLPRIMMPQAA